MKMKEWLNDLAVYYDESPGQFIITSAMIILCFLMGFSVRIIQVVI